MPTITVNPNLAGMTILSSREFDGVETLDIVTRTASQLTLSDMGDLLTFRGSNIGYQMSGGQIVGITGGTVTSVSISFDGQTIFNWTGLNVSAPAFFTYAVTDNWDALNTLLFSTGDTYKLTNGRDAIRGFGGNDVMTGFGGKDRLFGDTGNDKLFGGLGDDSLNGGTGSDTLLGGEGLDTVVGGTGADVFAFTEKTAADHDIVTDFNAADDALHFDNNTFNAFSYTGQLRAGSFVAGTAATESADRFIYQKSTGNLWYDRDGSGSAAKVLVAELADGTTLTAADIFIL